MIFASLYNQLNVVIQYYSFPSVINFLTGLQTMFAAELKTMKCNLNQSINQ